MHKNIKEKVRVTTEVLAKHIETPLFSLEEMEVLPSGYRKADEFPPEDAPYRAFRRHERVHGKDSHFWFRASFDTPAAEDGKSLALKFTTGAEGGWDATNPQGLLYLNGTLITGTDVNHRTACLSPETHYEMLLYFYTGMGDAYLDLLADVILIDERTRALYYDLRVPYEAMLCYPEKDYTHIRILKYLEAACNRIDFRKIGSPAYYESIKEASEFLKTEFYGKECGNADAYTSYVGHTHIDVAWLWTLAQTREKAQRSFATVLYLMDRFPEYVFMSSQPQLFKYVKEAAPALYEKLKERIAEGRFEVEGAMWLEADCNLTSGESIARQLIHGKRFIKEEFGTDSHILWLPDVFGYSAALPQLLKLAGVDRFVTSKISWNDTNKLPYDTFLWQGIDGSEVFSYFLTARDHDPKAENDTGTTYNAHVRPTTNLGTWERYQQKEYNNETIVTYGYGDGGGGPTEEMLETLRRLTPGIPGQPKAGISRAGDFLDRVEKNFYENAALLKRTPRWVGELYLEYHRGTYTSIAKNKRNNRKSEFLLADTEALAMISSLLFGTEYPKELLYRNWETVLLNQFHDIIPGSSIFEVYEDCDRMYAALRKEVGDVWKNAVSRLAKSPEKAGIFVYNPNGFQASSYVCLPGGKMIYAADIPALGYRVIDPEEGSASPFVLSKEAVETPYYRIRFDEAMCITSLYDKENAREIVPEGSCFNRLRAFENYPLAYDNWEISNYYEQKYWDITEVVSVRTFEDGGTAGLIVVYRYMDSVIEQTITVYEKSRRIDFETYADWHEDHILLKALFPVNVKSEELRCEVQYGHVKRPTHRNTSWDEARFEVCAHKWVDLSENGYGVSILNDCKYGHSCLGNVMTLSLIKTGTYPNEHADQGHHRFTYAVLPHAGSFEEADTVQEAYLLNRPMTACETPGGGSGKESFSLASADQPNVLIEAVKMEEDGDGMVVRLYECMNRKTDAVIRFGVTADEIVRTDLLENETEALGNGSEVRLSLRGFEIVTLLLRSVKPC